MRNVRVNTASDTLCPISKREEHTVKYCDYESLKALNDTAVKNKYNRSLYFDKLPIKKDTLFPIKDWMVHEYATGNAIRTSIVLNEEGDSAWLDIPVSMYNKLPDFQEEKNDD